MKTGLPLSEAILFGGIWFSHTYKQISHYLFVQAVLLIIIF